MPPGKDHGSLASHNKNTFCPRLSIATPRITGKPHKAATLTFLQYTFDTHPIIIDA